MIHSLTVGLSFAAPVELRPQIRLKGECIHGDSETGSRGSPSYVIPQPSETGERGRREGEGWRKGGREGEGGLVTHSSH
jgi:hypothetical protein